MHHCRTIAPQSWQSARRQLQLNQQNYDEMPPSVCNNATNDQFTGTAHRRHTWWPLGVGTIIKMADAPINNQSTPHTTIANLHRIPARSSGLNDPLLNPVAEQEQ